MDQVRKKISYLCRDTIDGNIDGSGVCCAIMDTGIWPHPDFGNRIIGFRDFVNHRKRAYDDSSHGTHVSGILAGNGRLSGGKYAGMAPGSSILMLKVLDEKGNGSFSNIFMGMEWLLANYRKYHVRIVNISVGTPPEEVTKNEDRLLELVDALWDEGLIVVVAAGNYGPRAGSIAIPGNSRKVITVGSSNDYPYGNGASARRKYYYSGRGPTQDCVMKPDVVAPGSGIHACNARYRRRGAQPYTVKSGTSMATPVVAGAISLLLSKYPEMDNTEVKLRLRECCTRLNLPDNQQGWGEINVKRLLHSQKPGDII